MTKRIFFLSLILLLFAANVVLAVQIDNPLSSKSFDELIGKISGFLLKMGLVIAPVMFTVAAFMWVIAGGSPEKVKSAQKMILYTAIGLAILLLASGLAQVLQSIIGVKGT